MSEGYEDLMGSPVDYSDHSEVVTPIEAMQYRRSEMDSEEKQAGQRFHDSGSRIPGRQKGLNDANPDRPARLTPLRGQQ